MGIKYLDAPKTSSRVKYLDEQPAQKFFKAGREVSEQDFLSPGKLHIQSPLLATAKGASDVIGGPFAPNYYTSRIPRFLGGQGLAHPEAMKYSKEVSRPIEEAKIEGIPGQIGYGLAQVAPILAGAPTPFMAGAKGLLGVASKIPIAGKLAKMPIAKTALGFGGYEAAKRLVGGETDVAKSFGEGVVGGAVYHLGLRLGATLGKMFLPTKIAEKVGSAAGAGAVGALAAPEGEKVSSALVGAGFGAKYPAKAFRSETNVPDYIIDSYKKAMGGRKQDTAFKIKRQNDAIVSVVKDIAQNTEEHPKSRSELFKAAQERQDVITSQIEDIIKSSDKKIKIDTIKVGNKVAEFARDKNIQTLAPELSLKAQKLAQSIMARRGLSVKQAHDLMKDLNEMARASYTDPNPYRMKSVEMYRAAADALRADLNKTVDSLTDPRYSNLKRQWGSYEELMKDMARASEKELHKTPGMVSSGFDAYLLGDVITAVATGQPQFALRPALIKGGFELRKYLTSPEKNIERMFSQAKSEYSPKSYKVDELAEVAAEKLRQTFSGKQLAIKPDSGQESRKLGVNLENESGQASFGKKEPQDSVSKARQKTLYEFYKASKEFGDTKRAEFYLQQIEKLKTGNIEPYKIHKEEVDFHNLEENINRGILKDPMGYLKMNDAEIKAEFNRNFPQEQPGAHDTTEMRNILISKIGKVDYLKKKLKDKSGQAVFGKDREEPQKPVFGVKPQEPASIPAMKPIVQPSKDLLGKPGIVEGKPLTAAEAVKQEMGAEEWVSKQPVVYHGTKYSFEQFDPSHMGKLTKAESAKNAFFFTDKKDIAEGYANLGDMPQVEKLQSEVSRLEKIAQKNGKNSDWEKHQKALEKYEDAALGEENKSFVGEIKDVILDIKNPMIVDKKGYSYNEKELANWTKEAKLKGHDGLIIKNAADSVNTPVASKERRPDSEISNVYAVFKPEQIKSKSQLLSEYEAAKKAHGRGTALGLAGLTAAGTMMAGQAQADEKKQTFSDEDAILSIIGEAENQGADGMRAVASAIRNRGTLKGVYGLNAPRVKGKKYSKEIYAQAKKAWEESAKNDYAKGATHWEGTAFKKPYWADSMDEVMTVGQQRFYKEKIKNKPSKPADKG